MADWKGFQKKFLREAVFACGSQYALAKKLGFSKQRISSYWTCTNCLPLEVFLDIVLIMHNINLKWSFNGQTNTWAVDRWLSNPLGLKRRSTLSDKDPQTTSYQDDTEHLGEC